MGRDLRRAVRSLHHQPAVSASAVLTFALALSAIGVTWGAFDAVVLRAVPGPHPSRVVTLAFTSPLVPTFRSRLSLADAASLRARSRTLEHVAAYAPIGDLTITGRRTVAAVQVAASAGFFEAFGLAPVKGRWLSPDDPADGAMVMSDAIWQQAFDRDPEIIGQSLEANGRPYLVVGVAPPGVNVPDLGRLVWTNRALPNDGSLPTGRDQSVVGLPRAGLTAGQVEAELNDLLNAGEGFSVAEGVRFSVTPLRDQIVGPTGRAIVVLAGGVGLLLLIACVNVAALLLAREGTRHREAAIRRALGASRVDLYLEAAAQVLTLALLGTGAGLALATWETAIVRALAPRSIPGLQHVHVDPLGVVLVLAIALVAAVVVAILPANQAWSASDPLALREGGLVTPGPRGRPRRRRRQTALVATQIALVVSLATGAALLARSLVKLLSIDVGFQPTALTAYLFDSRPAMSDSAVALRQLLQDAQRLADVTAAFSTLPPFLGLTFATSFDVETEVGWEHADRIPIQNVSANYFSVMGIPILQGRTLSETGQWNADPCEVLVNESLARSAWPRESPLHRRVDLESRGGAAAPASRGKAGRPQFCTVVGVVRDIREKALTETPQPRIYFSPTGFPSGAATLLVRATGDPLMHADAIRGIIQRWLPSQRAPIVPRVVADEVRRSVAQPEFYAWLFGTLAGLALTLAAVGVFGVTWHAVVQRTREIGVRLALGARPGEVVQLIFRDGAIPIGAGVTAGILGALGATRSLASLLHEVTPLDPVAFAAAPALVLAVAAIAVFVPAWRARRVDPTELLRAE
ncbi:MAG TPA: ABC transporter permease [Vicinamibacterales bacterium]|nr:ABC transporter permease [Vicinamibacterales bacterium]